jgi:predicted hydrocarbon binding protein
MQNLDRLMIQIEKRLQTTMIGALDKMEKNFGYLWGHHKNTELTKEEEEFADMWEFTRNQILNQGNNQIRSLREDFDNFESGYKKRYYYNLGKPKNT